MGFGFFFWNGGANTWRPPMALTMVWPLILLVGLPFLPESPRWLCMQGRDAEAEQILIKLHSDPRDPENVVAAAEFYQIQKQMQIDRTLGSSWLHIIRKPSYRKRALLAIGTCGIVQCSGVLVINSKSSVAVHSSAALTQLPRLRTDTLQRLGFQSSPAGKTMSPEQVATRIDPLTAAVPCSLADLRMGHERIGYAACRSLSATQVHGVRRARLHVHTDR